MRCFGRWLLLPACMGILAISLCIDTQIFPQQFGYNPYTGKKTPTKSPYNPFMGTGQPGSQANPFTGAAPNKKRNPYTGAFLPGQTQNNPFTGNYANYGGQGSPSSGQTSWPQQKLPITGKAGPGLEPLDRAIVAIMDRHGIPGASLAVAKKGKLVYAKGFGWANVQKGQPVQPKTIFGLASLSKPLTALAILWLIEHGMLGLDDRVSDILKHIKPPPGIPVDPKFRKVTIRQLLNHTGGWNRTKAGDPVNWQPQIARVLKAPIPLSDEQFISFMMGVKLDFEPGTQNHYSNVGYIMLGAVVEKVSGQPYHEFIQKKILTPAGVDDAFLNDTDRSYFKNESHRYLAGTFNELPPMNLPMVKAAGGWSASSIDLVRFLTALDGTRGKPLINAGFYRLMLTPPPDPIKVRKDGTYNGLGWPSVKVTPEGIGYSHDGSFHGMRTFMRKSPKGVNWALVFNVSMQPDLLDDRIILDSIQEIRERVERFETYPDIDLFQEY